ncbi:very long chain fatty acid elongase AAEL008004-like isoform X2 [Tachypleus tridentatus]|uniref:very long chain fatty acid elongase AAEL008004-like isoform X2 n=1 Tax=Tachypleus tridentatus TaxID=6853 RepID=UPI003FD50548
MAYILYDALNLYNKTMENGDRRVQEWPLMQSPGPTITICLSYVYFVKVLGPAIMKNREPLNMRWLMVAYNFFMVYISVYIFVRMANLAWWYYISKFVEFTDTIFFVFRKKFSHVSTLHVIHHGVMPMSVWWGVKFTPGGHSTFFAFVNSFVHILMYIYYGVAAIGPHMYKYLWWKKYMTAIQMVQFIMIFVHSFQLLFRECDYPKGFMWWIGFHAVLFWFLFWDFYKNAYGKSKKKDGPVLHGTKHVTNGGINGSVKANGIHQNGGIQTNGLHKRHENNSNGVNIEEKNSWKYD